MLEVSVCKALGGFEIAVELAAENGITALFGRSGAGKSSIANMVAGLLRPDRGRIRASGETLFDSEKGIDLATHRREVGYVFQDSRLFPHRTVWQNLLYGRRFRRVPDGIAMEQVVELLGIESLLQRYPASLSGGERQRVAIGRAILSRPKVLLMDEPLASLDGGRRNEILPYIERLRDQFTLPILYISHSLDEVARLADTLVLMDHGKLVEQGPPEDLLTRLDLRGYTGRYQAGSVITGTIEGHDRAAMLTRLRIAGEVIVLPTIDLADGETVKLRVLARDVALARNRIEGTSIQNQLAARVLSLAIEDGPFAEVRLDVGGHYLLARITADSARRLELTPGMEVMALIKSVAIESRVTS